MKQLIALCALMLLLAGCAESGLSAFESIAGSEAVPVVEQYLRAKVAGDRDAMAPLICAALESTLDMEATSFSAVEAEIEGLECTYSLADDTVTCAGTINAQYGLETRSFSLGTYSVVREDGAWRWCGEAAGQ